MHKLLVVICFAVIVGGALEAQTNQPPKRKVIELNQEPSNTANKRDQQLYSMARSYINLNRFDRAIVILEDLVQRNPGNVSYYQTLLQAYLAVNNIPAADSLVQSMIRRFPEEPRYLIDRAGILYTLERKDEAFRIWNEMIDQNRKNINIYLQVAGAMLQHRLMDEAIGIYRKAIENIPHSEHLYQNIANLYQSRLMYAEATQYYLKYLEKNPTQENFIFSRILSFTIEPEQRRDFFELLEQMTKKSSIPDKIKLLTAQLYQKYREFDKSFEIYLQLDEKHRDSKFLEQFARAAEKDSSYHIALKAYQLILEKYPESKNIAQVYIGTISTLFHLVEQTDDPQYADEAFRLISLFQEKYPTHPQGAQLSYLQGVFYLDYYFDVDRAMQIFQRLLQDTRMTVPIRDMVLLKLGECHVVKGQLEEAIRNYQQIRLPQNQAIALLETARVRYFQKQWEEAAKTAGDILNTQGIKNEVANDAIDLQLRLSLAASAPEVLEKLSQADLLIYQRKKSEALKKLDEVSRLPNTPAFIKSEVMLRMANLALDLEDVPGALEYCTAAVQDSALTHYTDQHLFLMGSILEKNLQKPAEAFAVYQKLLERYPHSLVADKTRERLKYLKETKPDELP
ncbi:MAG: hypothetical protein Kow0042_12040 [Calditrichia bacterium]